MAIALLADILVIASSALETQYPSFWSLFGLWPNLCKNSLDRHQKSKIVPRLASKLLLVRSKKLRDLSCRNLCHMAFYKYPTHSFKMPSCWLCIPKWYVDLSRSYREILSVSRSGLNGRPSFTWSIFQAFSSPLKLSCPFLKHTVGGSIVPWCGRHILGDFFVR